MNREMDKSYRGLAAALMVSLGLALTSCSTPPASTGAGAPKSATQKGTAIAQGGAQLWAQACVHCHNIRSPSSYSDSQWDVVMLHMRVRANLTAEQHKQILVFLRSAH